MSEFAVVGGAAPEEPIPDFLSGGGELGALMRTHAWDATPLGPPVSWPQSLKMAVRIMLTSRQPIWIGWGKELTYFYNDPYKSIIGGKHPWALGRPTREVWGEIWSDIGPMLDTALGGDQGTYVESQLLIMERNGYPEETYYTFSYSPIPNDDGTVGGIICANSDDTQRAIGERQLALLRDLAADAGHARSWREACERSAKALQTNQRDLPFALIYVSHPDDPSAQLAGASGIAPGDKAAPNTIALDRASVWPVGDVLRSQRVRTVSGLQSLLGAAIPAGPWPQAPTHAALVPIAPTGETGRAGVLVVGLNPFRLFDDNYRVFLSLVAGQIAAAIGNGQAYEEERHRAEALAELDRAKTRFFSNVSHEFRTPLTLMLGPIEDVLNDSASGTLAPIHRNRLETAHRNSLRLLKLVNSLLDFSRIEAGRIDVSFEAVDLARFTAELASNFESAIERAGLALRVDCADLGQSVFVDRDMWEKIVLNLLSNAFKFTFEGEIAVELRASTDRRYAELTIRDSGVGVPRSELPRLFERFHRIEGQRGRSFEGSGIGLALVQELVKVHGGTIRADSDTGRGATFAISIPFGSSHLVQDRIGKERSRPSTSLRAEAFVEEALRWLPATEAASGTPDDRADDADDMLFQGRTQGARILVADDNADMRNYVRRLLGSRWKVEAVSDGQEALEALRATKPDLVITDVMMPRLDGFKLLRELRKDRDLRDLPVIVLSARAGEDARVEGLNAGADDYLIKPFSARELVARVNANLEMAQLRREATRDLRESEARFRNMSEHAPVMMWMTDPLGSLTYLNRLWSEFTGQPHEESLGVGAWDALHPEDRERSRAVFLDANAAREPFRIEYRLRRSDNVYRWALSAAGPRFGDDGQFLGYIGSVIDIEDRKEAEQILQHANEKLAQRVAAAVAEQREAEAQLRQAQKMEAVGKLTGGVAHDFNNVLQIISGNLQLLARDMAGNLRAEQRLQTAISAISRGSKLASQLLAFGRRQPLAPKVVNLGRLIRSIDDMLRRALGEGVEIETIVSGGLWNTFIDTDQVENALLNLAINARDAMDGHGKLTIEAGNAFLDQDYSERHAEVTAGQYVVIAITDTGCGMVPDIIEHAFEPFFTTKPEGQGTGLGLSMVYGFVKQSGGHIKIYSELGQGTTIRIYLPRARDLEDLETDIETGPVTGGSETVLVVEDDEEVRRTVVDMLTDLGYRVLKAKDAQSALAIIESGVPIDLLFTDVVMPGPLRSPELARKARERLPRVAVLFTSGYTENAIVHGGRLNDGIALLSKPYHREALARKIRFVLRNQQQRDVARSALSSRPLRPAVSNGAPSLTRPLRVLLVEDDDLIRLSTADMLGNLGHSVVEAANGAKALELLGKGVFDVVVTDLALPDMPGEEIAARARKQQPGLGIVLATGYEVTARQDELRGAVALQKPYDEPTLASAVRAAIASSESQSGAHSTVTRLDLGNPYQP
jgi:PAS domain S-box-containing protein